MRRSRYDQRVMSVIAEPPLRCPACPAVLVRADLIRHLWTAHRLVLVGETAHEPWPLLTGWVEEYHRSRDADLLERCRKLAKESDPAHGPARLEVLFVDAERRRQARSQGASICPHCYAFMPMPDDRPLKPLNVSRGRITGGGCRVEVRERFLLTNLEMETPAGVVYRGPEPGRRFTPRGALVACLGPCVLLALLLDFLGAYFHFATLVPVMVMLGVGLLLAAGAYLGWHTPAEPVDRAVGHAWTRLVPRLLRDDPGSVADFLAGLALLSLGRGDARQRVETLRRLMDTAEPDQPGVPWPAGHRGAVWRLSIEDAGRMDVDPVPLLVAQAARFFDGELPFAFVDALLHDWQNSTWDETARARLRVLLCDQAFEAGCELCHLEALAERSPGLGAALAADRPSGLAALRLLWSLRTTMPWSLYGEADTVFNIAVSPQQSAKHLRRNPDLLLTIAELPGGAMCAGGMVIAGERFVEMPTSFEVRPRPTDGEFALFIGERLIAFDEDPSPLLTPLQHWFRYCFSEFRPRVAEVYGWRTPGLAHMPGTTTRIACTSCGQPVVPRLGEVGLQE
jgi:hypothetical protein